MYQGSVNDFELVGFSWFQNDKNENPTQANFWENDSGKFILWSVSKIYYESFYNFTRFC